MIRVLVFVWIASMAAGVLAQEEQPASKEPSSQGPAPQERTSQQAAMSPVERGKYLVHHVAMCVICHTPKTNDGRLILAQLLEGAPMPVASPYPRQMWAFRAPTLAGLGGFTEEDIVTLLRTGSRPDGERPQPPMPPFRMTEEDARAVAAYLKSLR